MTKLEFEMIMLLIDKNTGSIENCMHETYSTMNSSDIYNLKHDIKKLFEASQS